MMSSLTLKHRGKLLIKLLILASALVIVLLLTGCIRGTSPIGWSGIISNDGTAYTGSKEGRLVSVNLTSGAKQFAETLKVSSSGSGCTSSGGSGGACGGAPPAVAVYGSPAFASTPVGNLVYLAGYNGKVFAYDAANIGQQRWVYPLEGNLDPIVSGITIANNILYFAGTDRYVYALDASFGTLKWKVPTEGEIWATPVVDNNTVFIGSFDKKIYALDAATGAQKWNAPFETGANNVATALVSDGIVYIGSLDNNLYALNETSGQEIWRCKGGNWFWARPVELNGLIYAPCLDNNVYVLEAKTGKLVRTYDAQGQVAASPVVIGSNVIVATQNTKLWSIDTANPANSPVLLMAIPESAAAPLCAVGNSVYVNGPDNKIYGYDLATKTVLQTISLSSQ
jgi:eukaryotic-like serine/threonine-protein kinase